MGCDIHLFCEIKVDEGKWKGLVEATQEYQDEDWLSFRNIGPNYDGRNYNLFSILANVRNGYGFAGCDTGDGFVPIDKPRGLPDDVSGIIKQSSDQWGLDGHSFVYTILTQEIYFVTSDFIIQFMYQNKITLHKMTVTL